MITENTCKAHGTVGTKKKNKQTRHCHFIISKYNYKRFFLKKTHQKNKSEPRIILTTKPNKKYNPDS